MHAFAAGEERRAGDDLLDRPLENARMTDYSPGKRAILDGRPGEHRQNVVNAPATEQDVDADLHGSPSGRDLALAVEGDDLEVGRRAVEPRRADVHEAVGACVHTHSEVEPVAEWIEPYRELRHRYRALYPALSTKD